ncbi:MAG: DNA-binding response regulator [Myxococcales bacterium]|nr:MAG: DNA-binding response regulator [Myxococcales bacterium]
MTMHKTPFSRVVKVDQPGDRINYLTSHQQEVLRAVCQENTRDAAFFLFRSYSTVKNGLKLIYRNLGIAGPGAKGAACYELGRWDERRRVDVPAVRKREGD